MPIHIVKGERNGDEGKGKIVDLAVCTNEIFPEDKPIVANVRPTGGKNAGHTIVDENGNKFKFHMLPSTALNTDVMSAIGNHGFLDPIAFEGEIENAKSIGINITPENLAISSLAILTKPDYIVRDVLKETGKDGKGSTKSGISQTAAAWMLHEDIQIGDVLRMRQKDLAQIAYNGLARVNYEIKMGMHGPGSKQYLQSEKGMQQFAKQWAVSAWHLRPYIKNVSHLIHDLLEEDKNVLFEGAQGHGLDVTYGKRPYVSSSLNTVAGMMHAAGVSNFDKIGRVIGVAKWIESKVGGGIFLTEEKDGKVAEQMRGDPSEPDSEYGTTTGRPREVGAIDLPQLRNAKLYGGTRELAITKYDCVSRCGDELKICVGYKTYRGKEIIKYPPTTNSDLLRYRPVFVTLPTWSSNIGHIKNYDDLPKAAHDATELVQDEVGLPVNILGVGMRRDQVIVRRSSF